ncbi:MAG: Unknown protein [uncultured Thiotrichaceae bacterium]|uniref:Glycine zipper 2TM domain-containing protein n=1 Tax=uncultured Thiotrichaceae bacterium TaxID=298394 RepID=A0A6S6U7Q7_9GAMM|nr:MAG: Unknown protein [uncultured Thiotrichaceae bacterium]
MKLPIVIIFVLSLAGCSTTPETVSENKAGTIKRENVPVTQVGMVTTVKKVTVLGKRSSVGRTAGRAVGSIAGGAIGSGYGSIAGSIFGSMVGGAAGSKADENLQRKPGVEITVRLDNGQLVTVTQLEDKAFQSGQRVKLIMKDGKAEVVHES